MVSLFVFVVFFICFLCFFFFFFFSSRRRHTRWNCDWEFRRVLFRSAQDATCLASSPAPHSHHSRGSHQSSAPDQQPHKAPSLPVCCQALTSCSPTIALGRDVNRLTSIVVSARPVVSSLDATTSRTATPVAPPP